MLSHIFQDFKENRAQFHQHITCSFCADIFAPKKLRAKLSYLKAARIMLVKLNTVTRKRLVDVGLAVRLLHGDKGGKVSGIISEEQRTLVTIDRMTFQRKVDSAKRNRS